MAEQPDPADEAARESEDDTGKPSPQAAPAAPTTPGPTGTDAVPNDSATAGAHAGELGPKLFAGALLVAVVAIFILRRRG